MNEGFFLHLELLFIKGLTASLIPDIFFVPGSKIHKKLTLEQKAERTNIVIIPTFLEETIGQDYKIPLVV